MKKGFCVAVWHGAEAFSTSEAEATATATTTATATATAITTATADPYGMTNKRATVTTVDDNDNNDRVLWRDERRTTAKQARLLG
jgi:hypothetical protein